MDMLNFSFTLIVMLALACFPKLGLLACFLQMSREKNRWTEDLLTVICKAEYLSALLARFLTSVTELPSRMVPSRSGDKDRPVSYNCAKKLRRRKRANCSRE